MPRKKKESTLALNQTEASKVETKISPVKGMEIEIKTDDSYFKKPVNEVTDEELRRSHKYYKWKREILARELDKFAAKEGICVEEMEFRGIIQTA